MARKQCIGFGEYEGRCENEAGGGKRDNPHWCGRCDDLRIEHIGKRFEQITAAFPRGGGSR